MRIEQPQELVNRVQYGATPLEERLGAADYTLVAHGRTICSPFACAPAGMSCPASSEPGYFCTNGMSLSRRDSPFANSGLVVTLDRRSSARSHVLAGMRLQRHYEQLAFELGRGEYLCPIQRRTIFWPAAHQRQLPASSYPRGAGGGRPRGARSAAGRRGAARTACRCSTAAGKADFLQNATLVGPEARGSSPVRFPRDARNAGQHAASPGCIPIGEGAGYAGGIVSAALDGLRAAKAIIRRYAPLHCYGSIGSNTST